MSDDSVMFNECIILLIAVILGLPDGLQVTSIFSPLKVIGKAENVKICMKFGSVMNLIAISDPAVV